MALINSTCLKARITVNTFFFFCSNGKNRARKRQATVLGKEKAELFCFPCWKDKTEITEEWLWHNTQREYPHGAALGEQKTPALWEQPCFGEGDVLCASLSPLARLSQWHPVAFMRVAGATFIQFRMYHLIFRSLFWTLFSCPKHPYKTGRHDIGPMGKLCPPGEAAGRRRSCVRAAKLHYRPVFRHLNQVRRDFRSYKSCAVLATSHLAWLSMDLHSRHSLKVAKNESIRQEHSCELKSVFYI